VDRSVQLREGVDHRTVGGEDLQVLALGEREVERIVEGGVVLDDQSQCPFAEVLGRDCSWQAGISQALPDGERPLAGKAFPDDVLPQSVPNSAKSTSGAISEISPLRAFRKIS